MGVVVNTVAAGRDDCLERGRPARHWSRGVPPRRLVLSAIILLALTLTACGDDPPKQDVITCTASRDCPGGQFCGCGGVCFTPSPCDTSDDCCANEVCTDGLCLSVGACETELDCPGGLSCEGCVCTPRDCSDDGDCAANQLCEGGLCLADDEPPCDGECGASQVCDPIALDCLPLPASCEEVACDPGETLIIAELDDRLGPSCELDPECACASAREVPPGAIGTEMSVVALGSDQFVALAHDHRYGDLVAVRFDGAQAVGLPEYIDGLPTDTPGVDPDGPRQGLYAAGPERGAMPSAALAGETIGVVYRDLDDDTLLFARQTGSAQWETSTVDNASGSGWFSDLAVSGDGRWVVAHLVRAGETSQLRLATSDDGSPFGPTDWSSITVDEGPGEMLAGESVPAAVAAYPSLVVAPGGVATVAYYNSIDRELRVAQGPVGGPLAISVLDPGLPASEIADASDAGLYVSLARSNAGRIGLAFVDRLSGEVRFGELIESVDSGDLVFAGELEVVDPGRRQSPPVRTGADLRLAYDLNDRALAAYQDATGGDLLLSIRVAAGEDWLVTPVLRSGVAGFSPHLFAAQRPFWVVHGLLVDEGGGDIVESIDARELPDL